MNYLKLGHLAYTLRSTNTDPEPIQVQPLTDGTYRITDGRHRAIAALIAGRPDVLAVACKETQEPDAPQNTRREGYNHY